MKKIICLSVLMMTLLITIKVNSQSNTNPAVTDVAFSITGTTVTVNYKVADAEQSSVTIRMEVSSNGGTSWDFNYGTAIGDIGVGVTTPGEEPSQKTITWTYTGAYNADFRIRIIADDLVGDQIYYSGKVYNTVTIGTQTWLKENINVGSMILGSQNQTNNSVIEKYCHSNLESNCNTYGGLYQWNEAMQYSTTPGTQGICPTGWHIPTNAEMKTLATAVGNNSNALKAIGQGTGLGTGTNTSGFSALLAGLRYEDGNFYNLGYNAYFWISTYNATNASYLFLDFSDSNINFSNVNKNYGYSVRCLKD